MQFHEVEKFLQGTRSVCSSRVAVQYQVDVRTSRSELSGVGDTFVLAVAFNEIFAA